MSMATRAPPASRPKSAPEAATRQARDADRHLRQDAVRLQRAALREALAASRIEREMLATRSAALEGELAGLRKHVAEQHALLVEQQATIREERERGRAARVATTNLRNEMLQLEQELGSSAMELQQQRRATQLLEAAAGAAFSRPPPAPRRQPLLASRVAPAASLAAAPPPPAAGDAASSSHEPPNDSWEALAALWDAPHL